MISQKRVLATFLDLIRINAPARVTDFLRRRLSRYHTREDRAGSKLAGNSGNLIVRIPGKGQRPVLLSAHMDTVAPTEGIRTVLRKGVLRSDGKTILGADDRAGIAIILELVRHLEERGGSHPPLELVFSVCEEIGLHGARQIPRQSLRSKIGYVLDSSLPIGQAVNRSVTIRRMDITVCGRAAHAAAGADRGINAIAIAAKALARVRTGQIGRHTTLNIGTISGGTAFNVVPAEAKIDLEMRSPDDQKIHVLRRRIRRYFVEAAGAQGGKVRIREWSDFKAFRITPEAWVARCFLEGARASGFRPNLHQYSGGSDANIFNAIGIPSLVLGTGYSFPHTPREEIPVAELVRGTRLLESILKASTS
jgi:tripeptide aminopeptidase